VKKIVFNQFRGIGDILFLMPVAKMYHDAGYEVLWPVVPQFLPLQKHFPYVRFLWWGAPPFNDFDNPNVIIDDEKIILPLRFSDSIMARSYKDCMKAKYEWLRLDMEMWRNIEWVHDYPSETNLYNLEVKSSKYCFVNRTMLTQPIECATKFVLPDMPIVEMKITEGFTMLDWYKVIVESDEIHTVATGLLFLIEISQIKAKEVHIYKRLPWEIDHSFYNYLFKNHNYIWG
jgi:hypothetical protein